MLCLYQPISHVLDWNQYYLNVICNSWNSNCFRVWIQSSCVHLCVLWSHCSSGSGKSSWNLWCFTEAFWHGAWDDKALEGPQYNEADHKEHYDEDHKPLPVPMKTQESQQPVSTALSSLLSPLRLFCFMLTNVNADAAGYHWARVAQPLSV